MCVYHATLLPRKKNSPTLSNAHTPHTTNSDNKVLAFASCFFHFFKKLKSSFRTVSKVLIIGRQKREIISYRQVSSCFKTTKMQRISQHRNSLKRDIQNKNSCLHFNLSVTIFHEIYCFLHTSLLSIW